MGPCLRKYSYAPILNQDEERNRQDEKRNRQDEKRNRQDEKRNRQDEERNRQDEKRNRQDEERIRQDRERNRQDEERNRQDQERYSQMLKIRTNRKPIYFVDDRLPYSTTVTDDEDGHKNEACNSFSYQIIVSVMDSIIKKPLEQLHDKIDNLSELIKTYVTDTKLASHDKELGEILNMLISNSVSAERYAWLESQVKLMAACCLPPECVQDLMNEWQIMRAIHQRRVELDTSLSSASTSAAALFDASTYNTAITSSDAHVTSDTPSLIPMCTKTHGATSLVQQANIEQHADNADSDQWVSTYMNAEAGAASNYHTIAFLTRNLATSIGKIIITMLQYAKYENVVGLDQKQRLSYNGHTDNSLDEIINATDVKEVYEERSEGVGLLFRTI